ncbi:flavin reductase family protein [Candidatus Bathyarchaeota archaeon]|nr:flavin reductase family protein [Candidatus Bathyarchaeota archaeon]NIU81103.1 flavin reductase family protein [Candidatus Bathyarchaeota archaeon]NIV67739.1 flavin reductase family protein [Candidatus Bathyarchaeota archaeon]
MKVKKGPGTALFPCPVVLVTSISSAGEPNIITLAWVGTVCSDPPMVGLGIRPRRYSFGLIESRGEFVVNIPSTEILRETDLCGNVSGQDVKKFSEAGLSPEPAEKVEPPLIKECPVNMECVLNKRFPLGAHHLFLGEVVQVHVDQKILKEEGQIDFQEVSPVVYNQGEYWSLGQKIEEHGFSKQ